MISGNWSKISRSVLNKDFSAPSISTLRMKGVYLPSGFVERIVLKETIE